MTNEEFENYAKCCWIRLNVLGAKRMTQEEKELSAMAYIKYADELESLVYTHIRTFWRISELLGYEELRRTRKAVLVIKMSLGPDKIAICGVVNKSGSLAVYQECGYSDVRKIGNLIEFSRISIEPESLFRDYDLVCGSRIISTTHWWVKKTQDYPGMIKFPIHYSENGHEKTYYSIIIENLRNHDLPKFDKDGNEVFYCNKRKQWRRK